MFIKVINWCNHSILARDNEPIFYLEKDNWDDNYFKTRYHLHLSGKYTDNDKGLWIGEVKILRKGQRKEDTALLETGRLDFLGYRFCSVGQSLDYYEKISRLDEPLRYKILSALRDIIIYPEIKKDFENEEGMDASLFHFLNEEDNIFTLAPALISGDFKSLPPPNISFTFQCASLQEPVEFLFESPEYGYHESADETTRVSVLSLEGNSVSGEFLSRLAQITYASNEERDLLPDTGILVPTGTAFTKIVCISYSVLPVFRIPGIYIQSKEQIAREISQGIGRFIYCGIHDLTKEMEEAVTHYAIDTDGRVWENENPSVEPPGTSVKSTEELCAEFVKCMVLIEQNSDKQDILENVFGFLHEQDDLKFIAEITFPNLTEDELHAFFLTLPPGHQLLFHLLATCVLGISPRSLVLFHEPESGMPSAILPVLVKSLSHILERENAFMIVSTQLPDLFSDGIYKQVSTLNQNNDAPSTASAEKEKADDKDNMVISHILGLPNDIFPPSS